MMDSKDERDDFWNIENMMPKRERRPAPAVDTEPVDVEVGSGEKTEGERIAKRRNTPSEKRIRAKNAFDRASRPTSEQLDEYKPNNPYFVKVRICRWPTKFTFYERFVIDGMKYIDSVGVKCEFVPYFSFMPQYNQMTLKQLRYYIWWRTNVKRGVFIKSDISYISLYLFELINIDRKYTSRQTDIYKVELMCDIWLAYRNEFPKLDRMIGEWLCDFCLIHKLDMPMCLEPIAGAVAMCVTLKEFYMTNSTEAVKRNTYAFVEKASEYNYRTSSAYGEKTKEHYDKHIIAAVVYAIEKTNGLSNDRTAPHLVKISRDAYSGALCTFENKRRIDIEYYSDSRCYKCKPVVTSLVKYSENKLRDYLSVKNHLLAKNAPDDMKAAIDEYYEINLPKKPDPISEMRRQELKRYEYYETSDGELNIDKALEIEGESWQTTAMLVQDDAGEESTASAVAAEEKKEETDNVYQAFYNALSPLKKELFKCIYDGDIERARKICKEKCVLLQSEIDEINEMAFEITSDTVIEQMELIGDYRDEFKFQF